MNIIFLDIDGVLNSTNYMNLLYKRNRICNTSDPTRDSYGSLFDPTCVEWFKLLINQTDAKIVISSTWRLSGLSVLQDMWRDRELPGEVIDTTIHFHHPNSRFHDIIRNDPQVSNARGYEIEDWLLKNPVDGELIDSYVIIDDDHDMLDSQKDHFVQTPNMFGFNRESYDKCIKIFDHYKVND